MVASELMSDSNLILQRQVQGVQADIERLRKADVSPLFLPWHQRVLNAFPLASSGNAWGDSPQPWAVNVLIWTCTVIVGTTNNATNFWTLTLTNDAGVTLATLSTASTAVNTWARLSTTTITQPSSTNTVFTIIATATLSPGAIAIVPALALLRTGN